MEKEILKIADDATCGMSDPLKAYILLKRIEKTLTMALESIKENALSEAHKYGQKTFESFGAKIELRNNPGKWNFENIKAWNEENEKIKKIEEQSKDAFKMNTKGEALIDTITGEIIQPAEYNKGKKGIFIELID